MIRGAFRRTLVTEMYARILLLVLSAVAGSIGLALSGILFFRLCSVSPRWLPSIA
jgi:hypothetical protein